LPAIVSNIFFQVGQFEESHHLLVLGRAGFLDLPGSYIKFQAWKLAKCNENLLRVLPSPSLLLQLTGDSKRSNTAIAANNTKDLSKGKFEMIKYKI